MKTIVIYYSNKGSNRYLAHKIAEQLHCPIEEIRPYINAPMLFWMGMNFGARKIKTDLAAYHRVILVGPIWMGKFIVPLKAFVKKYKKVIRNMVFVTCCGSSYAKKDDKFGHGFVFKEVQSMMPDKCSHCEAFPITLVIPEDKQEDGETVMKTRLNDTTFRGDIQARFDDFIEKMKADS